VILMDLNDEVRGYWEVEPCGTSEEYIGDIKKLTFEWFERIEQYRYSLEPMIHAVAQFTRHHGEKILEIGVGAGTDHLQWARAGCQCYGVDLTDAAINTTRKRLEMYGFKSNLQRLNAESLPFPDGQFDVVYSWGVIHHSEFPENIIKEIRRVLKPGGIFLGMMYGRRSFVVLKLWIKYGLLRGTPWRSFSDLVWNHMESIGTKAYTIKELREIFRAGGFEKFLAHSSITPYDTKYFPPWLNKFFPNDWGWFIEIKAIK
jgi:ubiquinone/menaquinone biosynthesis C-methylase UbiE